MSDSSERLDSFDLERFVHAQDQIFETALAEIQGGLKRSHWMWFIFPQLAGLGFSAMAQRYAIRSAAEASAYLKHGVLGPRLVESARAVLAVQGRTAREIFGPVDEMKLRSCATLFAIVSPPSSVFHRLIDHFFHGSMDQRTLQLLDSETNNPSHASPI